MTVTLKDVAARAGVSRSAVSRCFTEGASVSPVMRDRVMQAATALGYSPNILARSLTTRSTGMIGLVSNNFRNPFFLQIFDQFTRGLQDRGLRPLLVNLTDETDPDRSVRLLRQYSVDGVIVASSTLPNGFSAAFRAAGLPTVHAFGRTDSTGEVDVVAIDNRAAGRMAAEALFSKGCRNLLFLGGPETATTTVDRRAGFLECAAEHGQVAHVHYAGPYTFQAGRDGLAAILSDGQRPDGVFCGDDVIATGALSAARAFGIRVPDDIRLIGVNDMDMAAWDGISLTTVRQPLPGIVDASVELLLALLADPGRKPEARILPCEIVWRDTA